MRSCHRTQEYHKYAVKVAVGVNSEDKLPFPAVTMCNLNPIMGSNLKESEKDSLNAILVRTYVPLASVVVE